MITNIAAYKFAPLTDLKERRERLLTSCKTWRLKGTILLSAEGINLFVAGAAESVESLLTELRSWPELNDLEVKLSESGHQPFNRMLVRIKKEIIAFGVEGIDPAQKPAPKIEPHTLKQWLDEGRPLVLLDTRNDYEVKLGTFKNAVPAGIDHFRDFPAAVRAMPDELRNQPIVMFCTGGIRCEKAGPFMQREGFKEVYQLHGGILKYFEDCGAAHYDGECFVFDQRVGVDPGLAPTDSAQCFKCLSPLTVEEQADARYVPGQSCPYCFVTPEQEMARRIESRHAALRAATTPLPGSEPYDNFRPLTAPASAHGTTALDFLTSVVPHVPESEWKRAFADGLLVNADRQKIAETHIVAAGERYLHKQPGIVEPPINANIEILHEDEALIVLNKPAPLPMHAGGRFNRNTLQYLLNEVYHPQKPRPAHRLDANTTGVLLVTRTRHFAARLQPQFARGAVAKTYLVRVQGSPAADEFSCDARISVEPGDLGARDVDEENGLAATTNFKTLHRFDDGTTLLAANPLTGRTNQIRVHLWELGIPVAGDPVYLPGGKFGNTQTLDPGMAPLCLHAWRVEFEHPLSGTRVAFTAPAPEWAKY